MSIPNGRIERVCVSRLLSVVGDRADHAHYQTPGADGIRSSAFAVVGVFPEESCIFFVNADDVLDHDSRTVMTSVRSGLCSIFMRSNRKKKRER